MQSVNSLVLILCTTTFLHICCGCRIMQYLPFEEEIIINSQGRTHKVPQRESVTSPLCMFPPLFSSKTAGKMRWMITTVESWNGELLRTLSDKGMLSPWMIQMHTVPLPTSTGLTVAVKTCVWFGFQSKAFLRASEVLLEASKHSVSPPRHSVGSWPVRGHTEPRWMRLVSLARLLDRQWIISTAVS